MNKHESNKMNSFIDTEEVMVRNESIWQPDEDVANAFADIKLKLPRVNQFHQAQKKNGNTATVVKSSVKSNLIAQAVKISDSAVSYAASKKDAVLEMNVKVTKSYLANLSQLALLDTLTVFYNYTQPLNGSLKHLEPGDLDKLAQLLQSFKTSMPQTGANNDESKTATQNMGETIKELNSMFKTLDKHLKPYKYTQPDFYSDYTNSRKVKDLKGKGKKKGDKME
jgi:hypothetical protein